MRCTPWLTHLAMNGPLPLGGFVTLTFVIVTRVKWKKQRLAHPTANLPGSSYGVPAST